MDCKKPVAVEFVRPPDVGDSEGAATRLPEGCLLAPAANPSELASLIRTFMGAGEGPRASGVEAQFAAAKRLHDIARASVTDALVIVSAEGLLRRVERNLAALSAGDVADLRLAGVSLDLLVTAAREGAAICECVAGEGGLLRALALHVARTPRPRSLDSRGASVLAAEVRLRAAKVLENLALRSTAAAGECARAVDALSDEDLKALLDALVDREQAEGFATAALSLLADCARHAPLLHRLVGPAGLPLVLVKIVTGEDFSVGARTNASFCIHGLVKAASGHGPPPCAWAKPIIKPLRAAFVRDTAKGAVMEPPPMLVGNLLLTLSTESPLIPAMASGMPDFVSFTRGGGHQATLAAKIIGNLSPHPGARAAAVREGAVPALVSLLYGKDGAPSPSVKARGGEEAARESFKALGNLASFDDSKAAILATDASSRLWGTLLGATQAGLTSSYSRVLLDSIAALSKLTMSSTLPMSALVDTGALTRVTQLLHASDWVLASHAASFLLASLILAEPSDLRPFVDAVRSVLRAFGPRGAHALWAPVLTRAFANYLCAWTSVAHEPSKPGGIQDEYIIPRRWPERGRILGELLVADAHAIPYLCHMIRTCPEVGSTRT